MPVEFMQEPERLTAALSGEIDHHQAGPLRERIDEAAIRLRPKLLCLDFGDVSFMDSSAVGLVMGRYRTISAFGGQLEVIRLSPAAARMMRLSGIQQLATLKEI
ncbi:MAG: anti-sigma factor antagonist [Oscillospiraceae bacterium]|nr:anti-sigma factor antagonist [Oscillospiraceae bacterium]